MIKENDSDLARAAATVAFRIAENESGPAALPAVVKPGFLQPFNDLAERGISSQNSAFSAYRSARSDPSDSDSTDPFLEEEEEDQSTSPSAEDDIDADDDSSASSLPSASPLQSMAQKRRSETTEDDEKSAKRARSKEETAAPPCDESVHGDNELPDPNDKLHEANTVFTTKLQPIRKIVATKSVVPIQGRRRWGRLCGKCASCTDPIECGMCSSSGCDGSRVGRCAFAPCLVFDYQSTTLSIFRNEAKSVKTGDTRFEDKFEELYGDDGVFATKLKSADGLQRAEAELPKRSPRVGGRCGSCSSCIDPMACGQCSTCLKQRHGKCIFALCLERDYAETTLVMNREEAHSVKIKDDRLERQFNLLYGPGGLFASKPMTTTESKDHLDRNVRSRRATSSQGIVTKQNEQLVKTPTRSKVRNDAAEASPRTGPYSCGQCSCCRSPFTCKNCYRCNAGKRCVFNLCQKHDYKDTMMAKYKKWAQQAVERSQDKTLKVRFDKLFGKGATVAKAHKQTTSARKLPVGTRVYARWPENNEWYHGTIVARKRYLFDIQFDDGDKLKGVTIDQFVTEGNEHEAVTELIAFDDEATSVTTSEQKVAHFLVNKGFYHHWINRDGIVKGAYGTLESCTLTDGKISFAVALDLSVGHWAAFGVRNEAPNPRMCDVEEADAWAGYFSFLYQTEGKTFTCSDLSRYIPPDAKPFYRHYIVSTIHACSQQRRIDLVVKGHRVQLKAKESSIPNGGLGLFITAAPIASLDSRRTSRTTPLVLEEGELIDLGVYGPLRPEDLKLDHVLIVKNFVHNWKSENWSFDTSGAEDLMFDITDDDTGELSKVAASNILVYTNETNGNESPTVFAKHDPEGAVHYYLGHGDSGQGRLSIPTDGTEVELKLDYGAMYESVRVRKGYSRLVGQQLEEEKRKVSTYEKDKVSLLNTLTIGEVFDAQIFLEKLSLQWTATAGFEDMGAVGRAMLVTLILLRHTIGLSGQEDDAGMHETLMKSLHELVLHFFDQFDFSTNRSLILENDWYSELLATTLELRVVKSVGDNTHSIRKAIQSLI